MIMRRSYAALAGCLLAGALAGCGSSSHSSGSHKEEAKSPTQVLADSKSALFNAKAVHVAGSITSAGQSEQVDLQLQGPDAAGTVTAAGVAVQIVNSGGEFYIKAPTGFWTKTAGPKAAALGGKWIKVNAQQAGAASQLTLQHLAANLNANDSPLNPKSTTATVTGHKAIVLTQKDGSQLFVADADTPLPLKAVNKGSSGTGTITFTGYDKTQKITAPAGAITAAQALKSATAST